MESLPNGSEVIISGRNPDQRIIDTCSKISNVRLIPNPKDMSDIIRMADIYICPTRLGGGLKLRIMDGLRLGLPIITHSCSARGYDVFKNTGFFYSFKYWKKTIKGNWLGTEW